MFIVGMRNQQKLDYKSSTTTKNKGVYKFWVFFLKLK